MEEKLLVTMEKGAHCSSWNYSGQRMAVGSTDGTLSIYDSDDPTSTSFSCTSQWKAHVGVICKIVWVPPEYGDGIACISGDGTLSVWEEVEEGTQPLTWKLCKLFEFQEIQALDLQFGNYLMGLKLVVAFADGHVKIYELQDPLELKRWQLQAEFQNVMDFLARSGKPSCVSASIAWNPQKPQSQRAAFVLGFNSDLPQFNSSKIWEFDETHQRWQPVAELALPGDEGDQVHALAWAPNIGRPYEVVAVATCKGIAIWHVGLNADVDGRLSLKKVALLSGHDGEVWMISYYPFH
ncbi:hypothetical protein AMTRI_Chr01g108220 [Amborella trichopoda]